MSKTKASADPTKRHKSRYHGITYRVKRDGSRTYSVYHRGRYWPVEGGENEALVKQGELRGKAARGEKAATPSKATFRAVAEEYIESKLRLRPGTRKTYRSTLDRILIPRFGDMKIGALTVRDVRLLIRDLERQGLAPTTVHAYLMPLRGVLDHAVGEEYIASNPCDRLRRDDRPQAAEQRSIHEWTDEEIRSLVSSAEYMAQQPTSRYDYTPLIRTALATGLRLGELLGLQWQDVDLHEAVLRVERQWTRQREYGPPKTKAGKRDVPLSPDVVAHLLTHKERALALGFSKPEDPVFAGRNGRPLGHRNATRRGFEPAAERAGIVGVSFHDLRHAYGSRLADRGIPSHVIAEIMGHESSAITEKLYIHRFNRQRSDEAVRQAIAAAV